MELAQRIRVLCLVAQSGLTVYEPMDCSLPDSSIHGILQARMLEWIAISSSRGFPNPGIEPRSLPFQVVSLLSKPPGKSQRVRVALALNSDSITYELQEVGQVCYCLNTPVFSYIMWG